MYKEVELGDIWRIQEEKPIKLRPSRLIKSVFPKFFFFHAKDYNILRKCKVDATMADHLMPRSQSQTHSRKMQDHHLMQLGGVVLPQFGVFLATLDSEYHMMRCLPIICIYLVGIDRSLYYRISFASSTVSKLNPT